MACQCGLPKGVLLVRKAGVEMRSRESIGLLLSMLCGLLLGCKINTTNSGVLESSSSLSSVIHPSDANVLLPLPKSRAHHESYPKLFGCKNGGQPSLCESFKDELTRMLRLSILSHADVYLGRPGTEQVEKRSVRISAIHKIVEDRKLWTLVSLSTVILSGKVSLRLVFQPVAQYVRFSTKTVERRRKKVWQYILDTLGADLKAFDEEKDGTVLSPVAEIFNRSFFRPLSPANTPPREVRKMALKRGMPGVREFVAEDQAVHLVFNLSEARAQKWRDLLVNLMIVRHAELPKSRESYLSVHPLIKEPKDFQRAQVVGVLDFVRKQLDGSKESLSELSEFLPLTTTLNGNGQLWSFGAGVTVLKSESDFSIKPIKLLEGKREPATKELVEAAKTNAEQFKINFPVGFDYSAFHQKNYLMVVGGHVPYLGFDVRAVQVIDKSFHISEHSRDSLQSLRKWSEQRTNGSWMRYGILPVQKQGTGKVARDAFLENHEIDAMVEIMSTHTNPKLTKVGGVTCVSCHAINGYLYQGKEMRNRAKCLHASHIESGDSFDDKCRALKKANFQKISTLLGGKQAMWKPEWLQGQTYSHQSLVHDLFIFRNFGYYIQFPIVSAVKNLRSLAELPDILNWMQSSGETAGRQ